ncbi:WYL domain-containing protein [Paenibacillus elgii]|uniref:WYL domain-containing protein n=1 Tax=Paenibacillus elgii TaxID=189691 RepID=UPI00203DD87B|nr:hypothetical protein [Paenibacillus elgii]MCM3267417.1 hypothetical protein [Paenibacillus elgii]
MVPWQKYTGRTVEIIYGDRSGQFSKRRIVIRSVQPAFIRAYCMERGAVRCFAIDRILAAQPIPSPKQRELA